MRRQRCQAIIKELLEKPRENTTKHQFKGGEITEFRFGEPQRRRCRSGSIEPGRRHQHILDYGHDNRKGDEMYYITVRQSPRYHQMTLEEFLFGDNNDDKSLDMDIPITNTKTYEFEKISDRFLNMINVMDMIEVLTIFNDQTRYLHEKPRRELYREFYIPKKSGGLRKIDAPEPELKDALRRLKTIFEDRFGVLYHTTAFAYIKHRSIVDCVKRHQENESKWFGKYDLSNFFGSTTLEFVMNMFSMIFPFSEIIKDERGKKELETALSLAFFDGGLPQGTPVSPTITNIMMIPIDFKINKTLVDFNKQRLVYTRYADDFIISSNIKIITRW